MLDVKELRKNVNEVAENLKKRGFELNVNLFNTLESKRKDIQTKTQELQQQRNSISKEIGKVKSQGEDASDLFKQVEEIKKELTVCEHQLSELQTEINDFLYHIPNVLHESVPEGAADESVEVRKWGEIKKFGFIPKEHGDMFEGEYPLLDLKRAAKLSGSRFTLMRGKLAKLHRALGQFMLDEQTKKGYEECYTPYLVNSACLYGTGQLPKFEEDQFKIADKDLWLIPTAEVSLTNIYRDEIINEEELPIKMTAQTPCFRSEAGSYGKDTKGIFRVHQFEKVELVQLVHPDKSEEALEALTADAESVLQKLELPYRLTVLCAGDVGFGSNKTYDIEVWLPGQNQYREISSCSNFKCFQARRMHTRFRDKNGKVELLHTLNGSGIAIGRALIAVIENYQTEDGRIRVPKVLQEYMQTDII